MAILEVILKKGRNAKLSASASLPGAQKTSANCNVNQKAVFLSLIMLRNTMSQLLGYLLLHVKRLQ